MRTLKYIVHFVQNDHLGSDNKERYSNAIEWATNKDHAVELASMRSHFKDAFLVQAHYANDIEKTKIAMVNKYGHHKGIA